jgi:hypothetical protein
MGKNTIIASVPKFPPNSNLPDLSTLCAGFPLVFVVSPPAVRETFRGDRERRSTPASSSPSDFRTSSPAMDFRRREGLRVEEIVLLAVEVDVAPVAGDARVFLGEEGVLGVLASSA